MIKKDYELIAKAIINSITDMVLIKEPLLEEQEEILVNNFMEALKSDNPKFSKEKFSIYLETIRDSI